MNTEYFRNFIAIVETGSMTAAAQKQFLSQPSLSNQLKALENTVGCPLFIRNTRGLELTNAGKILYEKSKAIVATEDSIYMDIESSTSSLNSTLHIGATQAYPHNSIDHIITNYLRKYPTVSLNLHETNSEAQMELLRTGIIDVALVFGTGSLPRFLKKVHSSAQQIWAVFTRNNPWGLTEGGSLPVSQLADIPLSCTRGLRTILINNVPDSCSALNYKYIATSRIAALACAENGISVALVPFAKNAIYERDGLCCRPLADADFLFERACLIRNGEKTSVVLQSFLEFISSDFDSWD